MPRYFFDLHNDVSAPDEEGQELPDLAVARAQAIGAARELMAEDVRQGRLKLGQRIEIRDAQGREALTVCFADAIAIEE